MNLIDIILSTRNPSKAEQIKALLENVSVRVLTLADAGVMGEGVEDGTTLEENALKKALFAFENTGKWSIADDSGIFIDALGGKPGVYAARWAGEGASTEDIMNFTLDQIKHVPLGERTAHFKTVAALVSPDGSHSFFEGRVEGSLLLAPRAPCQPKMPYSAIFVPDGHTKVWAEMDVEEENAMSHRGKAFRQVRDYLRNILRQ